LADIFVLLNFIGITSKGNFNVTLLPNATQLSVNVSLQKDDRAGHYMLYLYIPTATYELGVQGSILQAAIIVQGAYNIRNCTI